MHYGSKNEVLDLLKKVIAASDVEAQMETINVKDSLAEADQSDPKEKSLDHSSFLQQLKRKKVGMEETSGGANMIYFDTQSQPKKPKPSVVHPLFKKFRNA